MIPDRTSTLFRIAGIEDAKGVRPGLNAADKDKRDEYYEDVRESKTRLWNATRWLSERLSKSPLSDPASGELIVSMPQFSWL